MQRIYIYFNEGTSANGRRYKVPHTTAWGFDMTVQLNGSVRAQQDENGYWFIDYDPRKAGVKINQNGYLVLNIID